MSDDNFKRTDPFLRNIPFCIDFESKKTFSAILVLLSGGQNQTDLIFVTFK